MAVQFCRRILRLCQPVQIDTRSEAVCDQDPRTLIPDRPLLAINAFDDPIIYRCVFPFHCLLLLIEAFLAAIPVDEIQSSSHVFVAVTPGGGHLGWFTDLSSKERWVRKPISEFLSAATRDLSITNALVTVEAINGWEWVKSPAHEVNGVGGEDGRIGWRVLEESELVIGAEGTGVMQGL